MKPAIQNASFALLLRWRNFCAGPVVADKPSWAGKGKGHDERRDDDKGGKHEGKRKHFKDNDREYVRDYYSREYSRRGKCPPGLAKKNNGCMPPGQAKKWDYGRPLPRDVVYYEVPQRLSCASGGAVRLYIRARRQRYPDDCHRHEYGRRRDSGSGPLAFSSRAPAAMQARREYALDAAPCAVQSEDRRGFRVVARSLYARTRLD